MKFCNFLLRVDGIRDATLEDMENILSIGPRTFRPEKQKFLYEIEMEIVENRFFWMACDYDNAVSFRDYVVNRDTGKKERNPRSKAQIEPRLQFFACYDCEKHFLYLNDLTRRSFLQQYLSYASQKDFVINNVYTSIDDFCDKIKSIRGFQYTQVDNFFGRSSDLFSQVGNMWGQDLPQKVQLKIGYGDVPVHKGGRGIIDRINRHKSEFENVVIIGCDDQGIEQTFDFSSVLRHLVVTPHKDDNEHFDPEEVKSLLLDELR